MKRSSRKSFEGVSQPNSFSERAEGISTSISTSLHVAVEGSGGAGLTTTKRPAR